MNGKRKGRELARLGTRKILKKLHLARLMKVEKTVSGLKGTERMERGRMPKEGRGW